ncbi:MAG: MBL fold metallo-hydrolase [Candidatus Saganbacteria bacterium]|nr:MBL fold metallo-hydrolase [Candidatus Saganbacteria bacterium]
MIKLIKIFTVLSILCLCTGLLEASTIESTSTQFKLTTTELKPVEQKKELTSLKIKWLGHAAFLITASIDSKEIKIITEPYDPSSFWLSYKPITYEADIVTISNKSNSENLVKTLQGSPEIFVARIGKWKSAGITIEGILSYRDKNLGKNRGTNTIYIFDIGGIRICHLGTLGHTMTKWAMDKIGKIDVLLIPVGGVYTIGSQDATKVVEQIKPQIAVPMHYKNDACALAIEKVDHFIKGKENVKILDSSEIEVLDELKDAPKIIVLKHEL